MQIVRKVYDLEELKEALSILEQAGIKYKARENTFLHDNPYTKNLANKEYVVLVDAEEKQRALDVFATYYASNTSEENFLSKLDNEDLIEILTYEDNYSVFDINESKVILTERGIDESEQKLLIEQRVKKDNEPQKVKMNVIIGGYAFVLIGGILGIAMGWYLYSSKATNKVTKQTYNAHDNNSRFHGLLMLALGGITTLFYLWFGLYWWDYFR